ncbi:hypothetical protein CAPTEDRAFT_185535 [Capitella teleta]|uniref:Uncharacterized protein n=1 Tax=Capitella teleta TaxID=283909 RepID=R7T3U6_CAPTE|nr:hypothetical protein CAPTEDRAFT_185535 [Capitella teleta]|eukprot:ELT87356.1 hypothetical protein CAPTEDRAFT_185535 [Capitella teleta]
MREGDGSTTCKHLCDPVLAYISMSLKKNTKEMIKRAALSHFSSKMLEAAKKVLWGVHSAELGENKARKGSSMKSKEEFVIDDILDGLSLLDEKEVETNVVISVADLQLLPKVIPEETLAISVVERLSILEEEMKEIKNGIFPNCLATRPKGEQQPQSKLQRSMQPPQNPASHSERRSSSYYFNYDTRHSESLSIQDYWPRVNTRTHDSH